MHVMEEIHAKSWSFEALQKLILLIYNCQVISLMNMNREKTSEDLFYYHPTTMNKVMHSNSKLTNCIDTWKPS